MTSKPNPAGSPAVAVSDTAEKALQAWKSQFDTTMRLVEAMTESAAKMRECQLKAAMEAHSNAAASQEAAVNAAGPEGLIGAEAQWMQHNFEQASSYWQSLFQMSLETNVNLLKCLAGQKPVFEIRAK